MTLLAISDLDVEFVTDEGTVEAVNGLDLTVDRGEIVGLVGETGAGKSAICDSLTRLVPSAMVEGEIRFDGQDLTALSERELQRIRGGRIGHVFQQPGASLDPVYAVGVQITEAIQIHRDIPREEARRRAISLLDQVGIPTPAARFDDRPHQFSGGMRQRVAIAVALAANPDLLVADEPTTGLDVSIQAQVLELFRELVADRDLAVLLVTHDLGVVAELADRVVVLYGGAVMERGHVRSVFEHPAHPYTRRLFEALRGELGDETETAVARNGCPFRHGCPHAIDQCGDRRPAVHPAGYRQEAACVYYGPGHDPAVIGGVDR